MLAKREAKTMNILLQNDENGSPPANLVLVR